MENFIFCAVLVLKGPLVDFMPCIMISMNNFKIFVVANDNLRLLPESDIEFSQITTQNVSSLSFSIILY